MLSHLVGGPNNGEERIVDGVPHRIIKTVEIPSPRPLLSMERDPQPPDFTEHEYRLLHHDARYAIYVWAPPRVTARWEFHIEVGDISSSLVLFENLRDITAGRTTPQMRSVERDFHTVRVRGDAIVDGPPDGHAAKEVAAQVQAIIDRELRGYHVSAVSVEVSDG